VVLYVAGLGVLLAQRALRGDESLNSAACAYGLLVKRVAVVQLARLYALWQTPRTPLRLKLDARERHISFGAACCVSLRSTMDDYSSASRAKSWPRAHISISIVDGDKSS